MTISPAEAEISLAAIDGTRRTMKNLMMYRLLILLLLVGGVCDGLLALGAEVLPASATGFFPAAMTTFEFLLMSGLIYRDDLARSVANGATGAAVKFKALSTVLPVLVIWSAMHFGRIALHIGANQANLAELVVLGLVFGSLGYRRRLFGLSGIGLTFTAAGLAGLAITTRDPAISYLPFASLAALTSAAILIRTDWKKNP